MRMKQVTGILIVFIIFIFAVILIENTTLKKTEVTGKAIQTTIASFNVRDFPPVLTATNYTGSPGDLVKINASAYDPNGLNVTIYYGFPLNGSGYWQSNLNDIGTFYVNLTASDGTLNTTITVKIILGAWCGDGVCNGNETCESCPADCGECLVPPKPSAGGGETVLVPKQVPAPAQPVIPPVVEKPIEIPIEKKSKPSNELLRLTIRKGFRSKSLTIRLYEKIIFEFEGKNHSIAVIEVGNDTIKFAIHSEPIEVLLHINETKFVDINNDGVNELLLRLSGIERKTDEIIVYIDIDIVGDIDIEKILVEHKATDYSCWTVLLLMILIEIIILMYLLIGREKNEYEEGIGVKPSKKLKRHYKR